MTHADQRHNLLLNRVLQYVGMIAVFAVLGGGYWYWKNAQAGVMRQTADNTGLVGYWSFDEGAGTQAGDASGQGNTGTLTNGPTWVDGKLGKAVNFDGTDDYINLGLNTFNSLTNNFSLSAWITPSVASQSANVWSTAGGRTSFGVSSGKALFHYYPGSNVDVVGTTTLPVGTPSLVTVVKSGSSGVSIYVNGVLDGTNGTETAASQSYSSDYASIGLTYFSGGYYNKFSGSIDEVRVYNRVISEAEISDLYALGAAKFNTSQNASLTSGLVGLWSFNGADVSGTTAYDRSGNANNGTLVNGPTPVVGKVGQALNFDAVNDYVNIGNDLFNVHTQGTISGWIKLDSQPSVNTGQTLLGVGSASNSNALFAFGEYTTSAGSNRLRLGANNNADYVYGDTALNVGQWYHCVVTSDGSLIRLYVDGAIQSLTQQTGSNTGKWFASSVSGTMRYSIGNLRRSTGDLSFFNGSIDEVRVYNRTLSEAEISDLYRQGTATVNASRNNDLTNGLVGLWSFNGADVSGTTAYDRSGQGKNGTLTNGPNPAVGKVGQALSFDGVNDYVSIGINKYNPILSGVAAVTVSAWVNPSAYPTGTARKRIFSVPTDNSFVGVLLNIYSSSGLIEMGGRSAPSDTYQTASMAYPALNEWHLATGVLDFPNDKIYLYLDGELRVTQTVTFGSGSYTPGTPTTLHDTIGSLSTTGDRWSGKIDEVRVYNRALSAAEISALYYSGR